MPAESVQAPSGCHLLGAAIHDAREKRGKTQRHLAELLGVARSTVAGWESGDRGISPGRLAQVEQLLKVSFENVDRARRARRFDVRCAAADLDEPVSIKGEGMEHAS